MAISIPIGTQQLMQLGVGNADIALLVHGGKKIGNFFRVAHNDRDLLKSIGEDLNAILKRRDLIETVHVERRWSRVMLIYEANNLAAPRDEPFQESKKALSAFSWMMTMMVTALDFCLPSHAVSDMIQHVLTRVLDRGQELEDALRILLPTNIRSWRSAGCARGVVPTVSKAMQDRRSKVTGDGRCRSSTKQSPTK